jgi:hypothetical protein
MHIATPAIIGIAVMLLLIGASLWLYFAGKKKKGEL